MKLIKEIFIILLHLVAGNVLSPLLGGIIPGSVLGMILMFLSLLTGIVKEESVRDVAEFLTGNMTLFFLPSFIGIMEVWGILKVNFLGWILVIVLTTAAVLASSGWVQQIVEYIMKKEEKK